MLTKLKLYNNNKITSINHFTYLKELDLARNSIITNDEIKKLTNLVKLNLESNFMITDMNFLCSLKKIYLYGSCALTTNDIDKLHKLNILKNKLK
jgi:hypothetical protein